MVLKVAAGLKGAHGLAYMGLTLYVLWGYRQRKKEARSSETVDLNWLWKLIVITTGIWLLNAIVLLSRLQLKVGLQRGVQETHRPDADAIQNRKAW